MIFDTAVIAYALLGVDDKGEEAMKALMGASERWAPDLYRAELANVVWKWVHFRGTPLEEGLEVLRDAEALISNVVSSVELWETALELAVAREHPVYDTMFVALAVSTGQHVITADRKLLAKFPEWTRSMPAI